MGDQLEGKWVVPNPQIPRTFGTMNLVFGILLFLMGAIYVVIWMVSPMFQRQMVAQMKEQQATLKAQRESKLTELKSKEAAAKAKQDAAKTKEDVAKAKEEKESLTEEREGLENNLEPDLSAMTDLMGWNVMGDIRLAVYYFSEVISGMVLNVLMVISGVGLLRLAEWGRKMAIWTAWLKIVRWVAMTVVTMVLIVPISTQKAEKAFQSMQVQIQAKSGAGSRPTTPMVGMGQLMAIGSAIAMIFGALVASVYPAVSLWFLTRPPTRAACLASSMPEFPRQRLEPGEPL